MSLTAPPDLTNAQIRTFCERLWLELTIAGRAVSSEQNPDPSATLASLRELNEIQHRVWGEHASQRRSLTRLAARIEVHVEQAPQLGFQVVTAWARTLEHLRSRGTPG